MNILYVWDSDYPWDVRVEKICRSLYEAGHSVHIAARNLKRLPEHESINGLHIHRLKKYGSEELNYFLSFPAFFSPIWTTYLHNLVVNHKINMIIVRDLPLSITAIQAGRRHKIPVILDMAEDYVSMIWDIWRARKYQGFNLVVRNPYFATCVERYVLKNIDHILVVVDEARDIVIKKGGEPENITIVGNTPELDTLDSVKFDGDERVKIIGKRTSLIYTGGVQRGRGIQTVFDSIPKVVKALPNFLFVVIGDGYATDEMKRLIAERSLHDYVMWVGWVEHKSMYKYIKASKAGVIPHLVSDHTNTTIPNKIYDYMGLGLPVIASDAIPMKRLINEVGCGVTFRSGDSDDFCHMVFKLFQSDVDYGEKGMAAVRTKYNWSRDETRLRNVVENIAGETK